MMVGEERSPRLVAVGGFDPTGGAGVVRDFITARALGAEVRMVPTALTEQSAAGVRAIEPRASGDLEAAVTAALAALAVTDHAGQDRRGAGTAVKVGMLPGAESVEAALRGLSAFRGPVVVDPVLSASSGGRLFRAPVSHLWPLLVRADLITPNAREVGMLRGREIATVDDAVDAGRELLGSGMTAVLIKGGHLGGETATDVLVRRARGRSDEEVVVELFHRSRLAVGKVRGTGCALATAIAVGLAEGRSVSEAVKRAKDWLFEAIFSAVSVGPEAHLGP